MLVNFVLDRSGSMQSCINDTIGGFNSYINTLKADKKNEYAFSLTLFDTSYETRYVSVDLKDVQELNLKTYTPNGWTALYDAIGKTVAAVDDLGKKYDKVLTVILTDGEENSSREFTLSAIKSLIKSKEDLGNWTFVFLGADISAYQVGDQMGIRTANSIMYNQANMGMTMSCLADATSAYTSSLQSNTQDFLTHVRGGKVAAAGMSRRVK